MIPYDLDLSLARRAVAERVADAERRRRISEARRATRSARTAVGRPQRRNPTLRIRSRRLAPC